MSEIPTARLRTLNVGLAAATQWLINFVIARTTLTMMSTMGFVRIPSRTNPPLFLPLEGRPPLLTFMRSSTPGFSSAPLVRSPSSLPFSSSPRPKG